MSVVKVKLFTDSRGRNLQHKLEEHSPPDNNVEWETHVLPGATLETVEKKIERTRRRENWDITIIIAGICNFTHRVTSRKGKFLEYSQRKADSTQDEINRILQNLGETTYICTITPADMSKFSHQRNGDADLEIEQQHLLEDIENTNRFIKEKSVERDTPTIDLAIQSYTKSLKKQGPKNKKIIKFSGKELPDGIHPSIALEETWAKYIIKVTTTIINKLNREPEDSTDESEPDTGNFKRSRRN